MDYERFRAIRMSQQRLTEPARATTDVEYAVARPQFLHDEIREHGKPARINRFVETTQERVKKSHWISRLRQQRRQTGPQIDILRHTRAEVPYTLRSLGFLPPYQDTAQPTPMSRPVKAKNLFVFKITRSL
ncbi:MAG: hypothetical protein WA117_09290 [Verrucomicrobiia bacterium]